MFDPDKIRNMIARAPEIKEHFRTQDFNWGRSYDFSARETRNISSVTYFIDKDSEFIKWRDELIAELSCLSELDLVKEAIDKLNAIRSFSQREKFDLAVSKLNVLSGKLDEFTHVATENEIKDDRIPEERLVKDLLMSVVKLQKNHSYNKNIEENVMNDAVRDMLGMKYDTNSQVL